MRSKAYSRTIKLLSLFLFSALVTIGLVFSTTTEVLAHGGGQGLPFNISACTSRILVCDSATISAPLVNDAAGIEFNIQAAAQLKAAPTPAPTFPPTPNAIDAPNRLHCLDGNGVPRSCDAVQPFTYHADLKQLTSDKDERVVAAQNLQAMAETPCVDGFAEQYPCDNVDLLSFLPLSDIGGGEGTDVWGWTDPSTNKEYALMGRTNGTAFVDISNPTAPIYLGNLPSQNERTSIWRDIKVYKNHAFIVADRSNDHGMQVFDLKQLRQSLGRERTFSATATYSDSGSAHNIAINEESGFAYIVGTSDGTQCAGGLHMVDIRIPTSPTFAGCFSDDGYTHDTQCVNYIGPDSVYQGREICFNSNEDTLTIADVTQKDNVIQLSRESYINVSYSHQGWLTEDQAYFIQNDELDELFEGNNTRTIIWDVRDLDNPIFMGQFTFPFRTIDHNLYVRGNFIYEANYASGLRILDASDIANGNILEVGYFDTYPSANDTSSVSAWSSYPYFESGVVAVSTITEGLFVLRPTIPPASTNASPVLINPGDQTSTIGVEISLQLNARDSDEDTLVYAATGLPDGLTIDPSNGKIDGVPSLVQTANVVVDVNDGNGGTDSESFIWTIAEESVAEEPIAGDADCSDIVDVLDALVVLQYDARMRTDSGGCPLEDTRSQIYVAAGDVNNDDSTDIIDALMIMQCGIGISNSFCSVDAAQSETKDSPVAQPISINLVQNSNVTMLNIDANAESTAAGSFILKYDASRANLLTCSLAENSFCHESQPGFVRINFVDVAGFTSATTIAALTFDNADVDIYDLQVEVLTDRTAKTLPYTVNQVQSSDALLDQQNYQFFVPLINR